MSALAIDLCCGLGGWAEGFLAEGFDVVGFDIERHDYGTGGYPGQLVIQDMLTLHGSQFKDAAVIVASPPCQAYSYRAMPWKKAKALPPPDNTLFDACFRIQREASEAASRHVPLIVENVKGAQPWVGRARWHFGSFYLWGDVPALMPIPQSRAQKCPNESWSASRPSHTSDHSWKVPGQNWSRFAKTGEVSPHWRMEATKNNGGSWYAQAHNTASGHSKNPVHEGVKQHGSGREWFAGEGKISRVTSSHSEARKAASAQIAKIPFPLARHIAKCFYPHAPARRENQGAANE